MKYILFWIAKQEKQKKHAIILLSISWLFQSQNRLYNELLLWVPSQLALP
jgi:hypothetical protein